MTEEKEKKTKKKVVKKELSKEPKKEKVIKEEKEKKPRKKTTKDKALLNEKEQKRYHVLSKIAKVITLLIRVCFMIIIPFVFLVMIIVPIFFNKVKIESNIIKYDDISVILNDDTINIKIGDDIHTFNSTTDNIRYVTDFLSNNSKGKIITFVEIALLLFAISIILDIYLLGYLEKIFNNFTKDETPFTDENTNYLLKICKLIFAVKIIDFLIILVLFLSISIKLEAIITVLAAYIFYYIFKYATEMQKQTKFKICD